MEQTKLFLDIDGVLLGNEHGRVGLARGANRFLQFVTSHFDCYWLTTHCQGDASTAVEYLRPHVGSRTLQNIGLIKPTEFNVLKTDALPMEGEFYWIEDRPLRSELIFLEENDLMSHFIRVDINRNKEGLIECLSFLRKTRS